MPEYKYNLNRPAHLVANAVLRDIEAQANVKFINPQDTPVYAIVEAYAQRLDVITTERDHNEAAYLKLKALLIEGMRIVAKPGDAAGHLHWIERVEKALTDE